MIISLSVLVVCIIGSSYALYRTLLSKNLGINTNTHGLDYYINYVKGTDITSSTLNASDTYEGGASSSIEFWKKDDSYDIYGKIELTVNTIGTNLSNSPALKYAVVNNDKILNEGLLKGTSSGTKITILKNLYLEQTKQIYKVYVWLDNNEDLGDIYNESLSISVDCSASLIEDDLALTTLTKLGLTIDTGHVPDFSTVGGNSGIRNDEYGTEITGQGDGTNGIYVSEDNLGKSYYFRGEVANNYVKFGKYNKDLYYGKDSNGIYAVGSDCTNISTDCTKLATADDSMYWRIIRINGDGSIRMIYAGTKAYANGSTSQDTSHIGKSVYNINYNDNAYVGYMYGTVGSSSYKETHKNTNDSTIKTYIDNWYKLYLDDYTNYLQDTIYCNDRSVTTVNLDYEQVSGNGTGTTMTAYSTIARNFVNKPATPSLKCTNVNDRFTVSTLNGNGALTYPVGLITTDETILSGLLFVEDGTTSPINTNIYLIGNLTNDEMSYFTMSPVLFSEAGAVIGQVNAIGATYYQFSKEVEYVRPVISLKSDVITGGDGTINNPFVVK